MAIRRLVLVIGGARSGKSHYAEQLAQQLASDAPVLFVATATAADAEMQARIAAHRAHRPSNWITLEAPSDPGGAIMLHPVTTITPVIIVDCLTLLTSNLLLAAIAPDAVASNIAIERTETRIMEAIDHLLAVYSAHNATMIIVTNEVGMGIVPDYPLGRMYRDILGRVNATVAQSSDAVVLMIAGLPIEVKALADQWQQRQVDIFH